MKKVTGKYNCNEYYIGKVRVGTVYWCAINGGYKATCALVKFKEKKVDSVEHGETWLKARLLWIAKEIQQDLLTKGE